MIKILIIASYALSFICLITSIFMSFEQGPTNQAIYLLLFAILNLQLAKIYEK